MTILERCEQMLLAAITRLAGRPRSERRWMAVVIDAGLLVVAAIIALQLRTGKWFVWGPYFGMLVAFGASFWFPIAWARNIYSSLIRFSGGRTMMSLAIACAIFTVPMVIMLSFVSFPGIPRTMGLLYPMTFLALLCFSRLALRFIVVDLLHTGNKQFERHGICIYGAGRAGQQLAMALRHEPQMKLVAFIDDDPRLRGQLLDGIPVHESAHLPALIDEYRIDEVLLAIPSAARSRRRQIIEDLSERGVAVRSLPSVGNIIEGQVSISDLREIQIEELLGRDPVAPNELLLGKTLAGRVVLVTGAGGSIGSELCRQILACRPSRLILVEQSELGLYEIERELSSAAFRGGLGSEVVPELCDVSDRASIRRIFEKYRPDTAFHAAAYKHVPLVEVNPISGLRNNVFGTFHTALAAEAVGVSHFILVSTDKAVRPTNVMGSSKRICELVLQARAAAGSATVFSMVRFGNVLGSSGSVVPLFRQQIRAGGPITLTDRRITRYFMTIPEAAQLVIQAGAMAKGGEVFVLDMGQSVRIYDLAVSMIRLCGLTERSAHNPAGDIEIVEIGLRPGEKLYEELLIGDDPQPTGHERIIRAHETMLPWPALEAVLTAMHDRLEAGDAGAALALMEKLVPEYRTARIENGTLTERLAHG